MTRLTRSAIAAKERTTRSKGANSKPVKPNSGSSGRDNPMAGSAKTKPLPTAVKRKREDDGDDSDTVMKRQRKREKRTDFEVRLPSPPRIILRKEDRIDKDSDEESVGGDLQEATWAESAENESEDEAGTDSGDDCSDEDTGIKSASHGSKEGSEEESGEDDSEDEDSDKDDEGLQKNSARGVSNLRESIACDEDSSEESDEESDQDDEDIESKACSREPKPKSICGKAVNGYSSKAQPDRHSQRAAGLFEEETIRRRRYIQEELESVFTVEVAAKIANEIYVPHLLGRIWTELIGSNGATVDDSTDDEQDKRQQRPTRRTVENIILSNATSKESCSPPIAVRPGSQVTLTISELRGTSSCHWNTKMHPSIFATETGGDWNPPPDDPSLSINDNKRNLLIRRALKWPLLTSGYESPESFEAAKRAEVRMDVALEYYLTMRLTDPDEFGGYMVNQLCKLVLFPAKAALDAAVANLRQPDLVFSRISLQSISVPAPTEEASVKEKPSSTIVVEDQRQTLCKKPLANSRLQPAVLYSRSKATTASMKSQKKSEKSLAKASSAKTTPLKSNPPPIVPSPSKAPKTSTTKISQPQPIIPSSSKASAKASPQKTNLPPPGTSLSSEAPAKTSPAKAAPEKSISLLSSQTEAVVSKSQKQPKETLAKTAMVKPSPSKPSQLAHVASSPSKVPSVGSGLQKQPKGPPPDIFTVSSHSKAPAARSKSQHRAGLASLQKPPQNQPLPSSPTSNSPRLSESSSSSQSCSRSPTPSRLQPNVTVAKGKSTQILPGRKISNSAITPLPSTPPRAIAESQQSLAVVNSSVAPPVTPSRDDMVQGMISKFEEVESSLRKSKALEMKTSKQVAELGGLFATYRGIKGDDIRNAAHST